MVKRVSLRKRFKLVKIPPLTVYVLIKIEGELKETIRSLKKIPGVKSAHPITGEYDVIVKLEAENKNEIENTLNQIRSINSIKGTLTLSVQPPIPDILSDVESRIREVIGETGTVNPKYGGYEVIVLNDSMFPWPAMFRLMLEYELEIWVMKKENNIIISCKSPST